MEGHRSINRRAFLSAGLVGLTAKAERRIEGSFVNESFGLGHRLRDRQQFRTPAKKIRTPIVIVGGGIAGLSAAWRLDKLGFRDFVLLEMEQQAGGNSRWGQNEITRFPWAAHYVPVPGKGKSLARELFEELGVLQDGKWNDRALCFAPQERLFLYGRWQEGIEPEVGMSTSDRSQFRRFEQRMKEYRATGEFTLPMEAAKPTLPQTNLDRESMAEWLAQNQFNSPHLRWYINYACRDDYGGQSRDTSAWAGIHYFASRAPDERGPLTWPEGNGWITRQLLQKLSKYVHTSSIVYRIARDGTKFRVVTEDIEYLADAIVFGASTFLAHYIIEGAPPATGFQYSPWLTANLTLDRMPRERDAEVAWDNVIYDSPALGYVDAMHMSVASRQDRAVWTYYWSLAEHSPEQARALLLKNDWSYWKEAILSDLSRAHPDIRSCVSRIDIMRMGHAMIRPAPGFIFSQDRKQWLRPSGKIYFANSDLSGFSIFEEAQYRGVTAAERALKAVSAA